MLPCCAVLFIAAVTSVSCQEKTVKEADAEKEFDRMRLEMVDLLRSYYKIKDQAVLKAMEKVRRHVFIPEKHRKGYGAYGDHPCPIGYGQTISQPFIVAYMTEGMHLTKGEKILEVGTGSGYQAAILAEMGIEVYTIEIIPELAEHARKVLEQEGYKNVHVLTGDGYKGWPEQAPFDAIIITCGPENIPDTLVKQLKDGGRMILPLGPVNAQRLVILRKKNGKVMQEDDIMVRFVPMVHGDERKDAK
jgi:protein-L-isoaspartate(D-aspartate) O-methyltransferase